MKCTAEEPTIKELRITNRQHDRAIDGRWLRQITLALLAERFPDQPFLLGIHLVSPRRILKINQTWLNDSEVTDVITFNHNESNCVRRIHGEIFICPLEAWRQAKKRRLPWTEELLRYLIHGLLHLKGWEDRLARDRQRMRRAENRWLETLRCRFDFERLDRRLGDLSWTRKPSA